MSSSEVAAERRTLQAEATPSCFTAHVAAHKLLKLVPGAADLDVVAGPPRATRWCSVDRAATCSMEPQVSRGPTGVQHEQVRMIRQPLTVAAVIVSEGLHFAIVHRDACPAQRAIMPLIGRSRCGVGPRWARSALPDLVAVSSNGRRYRWIAVILTFRP